MPASLVTTVLTAVLLSASLAGAGPATGATADRLVVTDPRGDVRPASEPDRSDIDARRTVYAVAGSGARAFVRFSVDLPRRVPARHHLQGFVVLMHGGGHDYYVSGNQTPRSVEFADRGPGERAYVEHNHGTGRTFTRDGRLTLRVPLASFSGRRLVVDRVYTHLGPLGTGHVATDHIAPPSRALRLR